jgi:DNA-binding NtrC family response regulator
MPTVMIVDDNMTLAYCTARNLQRDIQGLKVVTVASCREARKAFEQNPPSVAIVDFQLGDGNGIDLCHEISQRASDVSTILISGEVPPQPLANDLFGFLLKPYDAEVLVALVNEALAGNDFTAKERPLPRHYVPCEGYDRHRLRNRLGELVVALRSFEKDLRERAHDPEAIRKTVDRYVDTLCETALEVASGLPECRAARHKLPTE